MSFKKRIFKMRLVASTVLSLTLIFELAKKGGGPFFKMCEKRSGFMACFS
jgi:hypothetical protein